MENFVCDFGFGSAKWLYHERCGKVLSVYRERSGLTLIGEDAVSKPGGVACIWTPAMLLRYYPQFLEHCLDVAEVEGTVRVGVGLPVIFWTEAPDLKHEAILELERTLLSERVREVLVLPQGVAGVRWLLEPKNDFSEGVILGIDVGFNTITLTYYDLGKSKTIHVKTLFRRGTCQLISDFLPQDIVGVTGGKPITPTEVALFIEKEAYGIHSDKIHDAICKYSSSILFEIFEQASADLPFPLTIAMAVFFGGGTRYLAEIPWKDIKMLSLREPEFANARGFMEYLSTID